MSRLRLEIHGAVQGVGFRPYVYRLARELSLQGWVSNANRGVLMELEGPRAELELFLERLPAEKPPLSRLQDLEGTWCPPAGFEDLVIRESDESGDPTTVVLPEAATCEDCLLEILDPADRRFRYPFTNCTNCGPRFSIVRSLPYDRPNTSMAGFEMCEPCRSEYEDPTNRRFHAQPNACADCGPKIWLTNSAGEILCERDAALTAAATALKEGAIVAAKGLGGFHLLVDAANEEAVTELRQRKQRDRKPMALMVQDLEEARSLCELTDADADRLEAPEAPIVLLPRRADAEVADAVAPDNPYLGVMLPYTPLHHLLMREVGRPLVATSGNLSDEPICFDNDEARRRLERIADRFLLHDRPIARQVDDSVVRSASSHFQPLRRARGYAPLPIALPHRWGRELPSVLAVGGHLKNALALSVGDNVFLSQHVGDMETPEARSAFERVVRDFLELYEAQPLAIAHDLHPDYATSQWVESLFNSGDENEADDWRGALRAAQPIAVQHHHAHLAACLADNAASGPALGVTWDGTGYGPDGTIWGGEFLLGDASGFERVARLRRFRLPGAEQAVLEPRRVALALLWELHGEAAFEMDELNVVRAFPPQIRQLFARMLSRGLQAPLTSSCGRLFDGVAALLGLRELIGFEGEAAMALEFAADPDEHGVYPVGMHPTDDRDSESELEIDWAPTLEALLREQSEGVATAVLAARFHNGLAQAIAEVATRVGEPVVALTGGCFQNRLLTERTTAALRAAGLDVLGHRQVPPNDGSICLGQIAVAASVLEGERR